MAGTQATFMLGLFSIQASCHQSSSMTLVTPLFTNQLLNPKGIYQTTEFPNFRTAVSSISKSHKQTDHSFTCESAYPSDQNGHAKPRQYQRLE
jgi:hypothetical protein